MFTLLIIVLVIAAMGILAVNRASIPVWTIAIIMGLLLLTRYHGLHVGLAVLWLVALVLLLPLSVTAVRLRFLSPWLFKVYKQAMPKMSHTERQALEAGTVSWEGDLFNGAPDFNRLLSQPAAKLSQEEQAFLDGPVTQLCCMLDDWQITHELADLPEAVWQFIKDNGFLGMIIPKQYGGLAFSASAVATVLVKVYGKSITAATCIGVPNSLGPGELLAKYGTEAQKNYYLPRLAKGDEIPCFALTSPQAGSDAAAIPDQGIVCKKIIDGQEVLGINLTWDKRYITLCPIATVIGLAFHLYDPEHLLGTTKNIGQKNLGITCALIPANTPGVIKGRRHFPVNIPFMNGPTQGKDVFIPLDWIIGGSAMAGHGWRMLMECLSAGRAISLPSSAVGGGQTALLASSAYARVRKQFNTPIGKFEGIQELLARMAANTYINNAALYFTTAAIDHGAEPAVASAIVKYHTTEIARRISMDAMDIHGGKGICLGPKNYLGRGHEGSPIPITVEGANVLTRNLIIFGQGAIRCHQFIFEELESALADDLRRFDKAYNGHLAMFVSNTLKSFIWGISGGPLFGNKASPLLSTYIKKLQRYSAAFAFMADFAIATLGASLKRRERISARLGDVLSYLYLASAVIKNYHDEGCQAVDLPIVEYACQQILCDLETAISDLIDNFPHRFGKIILSIVILPLGRRRKSPKDVLAHQIVNLLLVDSATRSRLTKSVFQENLANNPVGQLEAAFKQILACQDIELIVNQAVKEQQVTGLTMLEQIAEAKAKNIITPQQAQQLHDAECARQAIIAVDDFAHEDLARGGGISA